MKNSIENIAFRCDNVKREVLGQEWRTELFRREFRVIPFSRIFYPVRGEGFVEYNGNTYRLCRGKILLIPAFAQVSLRCPLMLEKYWIHFNAFFCDTTVDIFLMNHECIELDVTDFSFQTGIFERILADFSQNSIVKQYEFDALLRLLIAPFLEKISGDTGERELPNFLELLLFIDKNLHRKLPLNELARHAGLCPSYLSRLFSEKMQRRLQDYIGMHRAFRAAQLIMENRYSIGEIGDMLGFSNVSVFSKVFKKHFGISPLAFRKNRRRYS